MKFSNQFIPSKGHISRKLATLSSASQDQFRNHEERIAALEAVNHPFANHICYVGDPASPDTFAVGASYLDLITLQPEMEKGEGNSYHVCAFVNLHLATGVSVTAQLYRDGFESTELISLYAAGLAGAARTIQLYLPAIDKANFSKQITYRLRLKQTAGASDPQYSAYGLSAIKVWS